MANQNSTDEEIEGLAGQGRAQGSHGYFYPPAQILKAAIKHGKFRGHIAAGSDDHGAAAADQVQHGKVLGNAQRVVQGNDEGTEADADPSGAGGDGPAEADGGGIVPIAGAMVLGEVDAGKAMLIGEFRHLQGRGKQFLRGGPELRCAQIKTEGGKDGCTHALLLSSRAAAKSGCQLVLPVIPDCSAPGSLRGEDRLFPTIAPRRPGCRAGSLWARLRRSQIRSRTASSPLPGWRNR